MCSNLFFHTKYIRLSQVGFGHVFGVWDGVFGMWDNVLVFGMVHLGFGLIYRGRRYMCSNPFSAEPFCMSTSPSL